MIVAASLLGLACESNEGGASSCGPQLDCPSGEFCLADVCRPGEAPAIAIEDPAELDVFPTAAGAVEITLRIELEHLELAPTSGAFEAGKGKLVALVDGELAGELDSGTGTVDFTLAVPSTPGIHRIHVQAVSTDGISYREPGGNDGLRVWVDDGSPRVGIVAPSPLDSVEDSVSVSVALLNASLASSVGATDGDGVVGLYVGPGGAFVDCGDDADCWDGADGIATGPGNSGQVDLSLGTAGYGAVGLRAVLLPPGGGAPALVVSDEILLSRESPGG